MMAEEIPAAIDLKRCIAVVKHLLLAMLVGWALSYFTGMLIQSTMFEKYGEYEWYPQFLSFTSSTVGVTCGGLFYALILYFYSRTAHDDHE